MVAAAFCALDLETFNAWESGTPTGVSFWRSGKA
jgi:hypothetical protein